MTTTVKMSRGNVTADVHPAEVSNFKATGWNTVEDAKPAAPAKAARKPRAKDTKAS